MKSPPCKILVITGVFPPTQIAEADHIARLSAELAARGYSVDVLTTENDNIPDSANHRIHRVMPSWRWAHRNRLLDFARQIDPDLVYIWYIGHGYDFHPMVTFAPTWLKGTLPRAKIVTQITAPVGARPKLQNLVSRLIRKGAVLTSGSQGVDYAYGTLLRDSDRFVAMAGAHLSRFADAFPALGSKATIIPPPPLVQLSPPGSASRQRGRDLMGFGANDLVFAYFGRLYRGKGLETLIDAFAVVHSKLPQARLAIVGGPIAVQLDQTWRLESLYEQAQRLGIAQRIHWSGEFPFEGDTGSLYLRGADIAVLPFDEGAALNNSSIAACAAHDLPLITTIGNQVEPEFVDGQNTLLIPATDADALAVAMVRLGSDAALRVHLRAGIQALQAKHFSWETSVDRTVAVFEDALAGKRELVAS
ncbi:MAG TPA: glycosyltransferase family 4 protein [Hyphomonadaceae bacterium]|nr:glycosyltransferase family 4 protein [Hyphomonadaceae bacterium]